MRLFDGLFVNAKDYGAEAGRYHPCVIFLHFMGCMRGGERSWAPWYLSQGESILGMHVYTLRFEEWR